MLFILPHPVTFLEGVTYRLEDENQGVTFTYSVNDLLNVLMLIKVFLIFRSMIYLTVYSSPRAIRLCTYNNIDHTSFFSIKCIQQ